MSSQEGMSALVKTRFWTQKGDVQRTETEIRSPFMKLALKHIIPEFKDVNIDVKHIVIENEPRCLFHFRDELFMHGMMLPEASESQLHVSFLLQYMHQELSTAILAHTVNIELQQPKPAMDFINLWTIFKPGELVCIPPSMYTTVKCNRVILFKSMTLSCRCIRPWCMLTHSWNIRGYSLDSDGENLGYVEVCHRIRYFDSHKELSSLNVLPLQYHHQQEEIRSQLLSRGRKFISLQGVHYRKYTGVADVLSKDRNTTMLGVDDYFPIQQIWVSINPIP